MLNAECSMVMNIPASGGSALIVETLNIEHRTARANARFPANTATLPVNGEVW